MNKTIAIATLVGSALAAVGIFAANSPAGGGPDPLPQRPDVDEHTPTSISYHEFDPPPEHGFRVTLMDDVVNFDGEALTRGQAQAANAAASGICRDGAGTEGLQKAATKVPSHSAAAVLAALDCSVSTFHLELDATGQVSGFIGTTDADAVDRLQAQFGEGVSVQWDFAGTSPGPPR